MYVRARQDHDVGAMERVSMEHFFYSFIHESYGVPNVALLVIHGILVATMQYRKIHPVVSMFHDLLSGPMDECAWKYTMYCRDLLIQCPVASVHDLQHFTSSLYSGFSQQETLDFIHGFQNQYTLCTSESLLSYLTSKVTERDEMRVRKWLRALQWRDTQRHGGLGQEDFNGVVQEYFKDVPREKIVNYKSFIIDHGKSWAPMDSLAFLCCCLEVFA